MRFPLAGRRVLVTRAAEQASRLSDALRALGAEPVEVPVLEIRPPASFAALDEALRGLGQYGWLIFTSANAVRALAERSAALGISFEKTALPQVAAVGEATAAAARNAGFAVALVPEKYLAESLIDEFLRRSRTASGHDFSTVSGHHFSRAGQTKIETGALAPAGDFLGQRVLLARAATARDVIPDALRAAGAHVDVVDTYRNVLPEDASAKLRRALEQNVDAATFTSSSSVTHLKEATAKAEIAFPLAGVKAVSIGPITSATLREQGWAPAAEADPSDIPGLVAAVLRSLQD